jgi:hypothetical protein
LVTNTIENYLEFTYLSPDSSIIEGRFQVHLVKRGYQPDPGEPDAIIIKNGKFRLKN